MRDFINGIFDFFIDVWDAITEIDFYKLGYIFISIVAIAFIFSVGILLLNFLLEFVTGFLKGVA